MKRNKSLALYITILLSVACAPNAAENEPAALVLETDDQQALYAIGQILSQQASELNLDAAELETVLWGLKDGVLGNEAQVDLEAIGPKVQEFALARASAAAETEKADGASFLTEAANAAGAVKTDSGLVYQEIMGGTGASPVVSDQVKVHYTGTLRDGTVFDSSVQRGQPAEFPLTQVVACWTEGLQLMKVGGKAKLTCPSELAYGDQGRPPTIPGGATLVFEVELLEITTP